VRFFLDYRGRLAILVLMKRTRYTAKDIGREVTFRRNGRLWTAIVGPSLKLICKRAA
jgi:hypothetical protein